MINKTLYNTIALGGTFDHLHDGHKEFILFAKEIAKFLIIGVTDQQMVLGKSHSDQIQPTHIRKQAIKNFCNKNAINADIITIYDPYGPLLEKSKAQAIACTTDTVGGADKINEYREHLHLRELPIHIHNLKKDKQNKQNISAQRIRSGEIDRSGNVYMKALEKSLKLTEEMRKFFSVLHGKLVEEPSFDKPTNVLSIVVGDSTLESFIKNKWKYSLGIFDGKCKREKFNSDILSSIKNLEKADNRPGWIESQAIEKIISWTQNKNFKHLFINGEEDLLAVIATILLPLGSYIYYGQPNKGMVELKISENVKEEFFKILSDNK